MKRGEMQWAKFDKHRPVVLVSSQQSHAVRALVIVAPVSTTLRGFSRLAISLRFSEELRKPVCVVGASETVSGIAQDRQRFPCTYEVAGEEQQISRPISHIDAFLNRSGRPEPDRPIAAGARKIETLQALPDETLHPAAIVLVSPVTSRSRRVADSKAVGDGLATACAGTHRAVLAATATAVVTHARPRNELRVDGIKFPQAMLHFRSVAT